MLRERGWLAVAVVLASMVGGAVSNLLLTARLGAQGADVVTASQVNIVDTEGRLRAVLAANDELGMTSLAFYGADDTRRGMVGMDSDGTPVLRFSNPAGVGLLSATVRDDQPVITVGAEAARNVLIGSFGGTPIVGLSERGRIRLQMDLGEQGEPRVTLLNSAGQRGVGLVVGGDDAPFVTLFDAAGAQRLAMGIVQGTTVLNLGDGTRPRLVLGVAGNGRASVGFYDEDGALARDLSADGQR
jgi:hypothetical protein